MATGDDGGRQVSHDGGAVGCDPAFAAIADVVGFEDEILDDEVFVALELGPRWDLLGLDDDLLVDGEFSGLRSFVGAGSFVAGTAGLGWGEGGARRSGVGSRGLR